MKEARKKYLWSVHGAQGLWEPGTTRPVYAVVLGWEPNGYKVVQQIQFVANDLNHANEVARAAFNLWCIAHAEEMT